MRVHVASIESQISESDPVTRRLDWIVFSLEGLTPYSGFGREGMNFTAFVLLANRSGISLSSISRYMVSRTGFPIKKETLQKHLNKTDAITDIRVLDTLATIEGMI